MSSIIVLNGPSSAGKTTLARAVRDTFPSTCVALSIDDFFTFKPRAAPNDWHMFSTLTEALFAAAARFADGGFDVIVDTVFERSSSHEAARRLLAERRQRYVAVTCPLHILETREQARGDRRAGQARDQHERVLAGVSYDVELDTYTLSLEECVERVAALMK